MSWVGELMVNIHNWWNSTAKIKSSLKKDVNPLRIGVLAAAEINYVAIIDPIQTHPSAELVAIAARSKPKAEAQIAKYGLSSTCKAYGSYDELLADSSIDAVYIPTPNGLHTVWAIKAMEAGKHVLIEKPIASNGDEVRRIRETSKRTGKVALEAFHWRFHPAAHVCKSIVESGKYGHVTNVHTQMNLCRGVVGRDDIRFDYSLGGGAAMDLIYTTCASWYFASKDSNYSKCDFRVLESHPRLSIRDKLVDEAHSATFVVEQPDRPAVTCKIEGDLSLPPVYGWIPQLWNMQFVTKITLEGAEVEFPNFVAPYLTHSITVTEKDPSTGKFTGKKVVEKCYKDGPVWRKRGEEWWTTYRYQLEGFVDAVRARERGEEYTGPGVSLEESERMMDCVDGVYEKAGLPKRGM